jgi:hypothetical protein
MTGVPLPLSTGAGGNAYLWQNTVQAELPAVSLTRGKFEKWLQRVKEYEQRYGRGPS